MKSILEQVAKSHSTAHFSAFTPETPTEYLALRLALRLGEPVAARHYADLADRHSEEQLLAAYRLAKRDRAVESELARCFHEELERLAGTRTAPMQRRRLAAIRIERRAIAVLIMCGDHIEYPPLVRQLPSDPYKAIGSAATFIEQIHDKCPFQTAALEIMAPRGQAQRHDILDAVTGVLRERDVSIRDVDKALVIASFSHPPLKARGKLRDVIARIWPSINGSFGGPLIKDALAIALYCHVEQLFSAD